MSAIAARRYEHSLSIGGIFDKTTCADCLLEVKTRCTSAQAAPLTYSFVLSLADEFDVKGGDLRARSSARAARDLGAIGGGGHEDFVVDRVSSVRLQ
jgi:hypothetical protein